MYYDKIDYSIIKESWEQLKEYITLPYVIHIVGTNGKGSTGRYIASLLDQSQKSVLHYSSPHILEFNERIWINGKDSTTEELDEAHGFLQKHLNFSYIEQLTYFEYTTLIALYLSSEKEYLVLEAGLGGEFDATNVVKNNLSVFTPISYDHQEFLGDTIEDIASTKLRSCDNSFIMAPQEEQEVLEVKKQILAGKRELELQSFDLPKSIQQLPQYLQDNFLIALNVIKFLDIECKEYILPELKGRFQYYQKNIIVDVGHNLLAAISIAKELKKLQKSFILVYNCFKDKNFKTILKTLQPFLKEVQLIPISDARAVSKEKLTNYMDEIELQWSSFNVQNLKDQEDYLVFGSFSVIENFLKEYKK